MAATGARSARIAQRIITIRAQRVLLDFDLAALYGVETRVLLQSVRRNRERFPPDLLVVLKNQDIAALRSQFVMSKRQGRGGRATIPWAFTEHGAIMAATVLNSRRAVEVCIYVVRAFVQVRESLIEHKTLGKRLDELESKLERRLGVHDHAISEILDAIRQLTAPAPSTPRRGIGFVRQ